MIMMPYGWAWSSLQLTGQANFWHPQVSGESSPIWPRRPGCQARLPAVLHGEVEGGLCL